MGVTQARNTACINPFRTNEDRMENDRDALITAGTALLGIAIESEWRAAIRLHLHITLGHAAKVGEFALPDAAEPAPVFRA